MAKPATILLLITRYGIDNIWQTPNRSFMYWNSLATETVLKVVLRGNAVISLRVRFTLLLY